MIEPLRISFEVACSAERAFELWTAHTSVWWPASHTVSGEAGLEVVIEPRAGGRIFERTPAGEEHDWGEVMVWSPPVRFSYLWHLRQDRGDATEVDISFLPLGERGTAVSIEHTGWERLGVAADDLRSRNSRGWDGLLPYFRSAASGTRAPSRHE